MNVVVFAQFELEPSFVVGGDFHINVNDLALSVVGHNSSSCILASGSLVFFHYSVPGVPTNPAFPTIHIPLGLMGKTIWFQSHYARCKCWTYTESSAVQPIVSVVDRCGESNSPSSGPCRRFEQIPMSNDMVHLEYSQFNNVVILFCTLLCLTSTDIRKHNSSKRIIFEGFITLLGYSNWWDIYLCLRPKIAINW